MNACCQLDILYKKEGKFWGSADKPTYLQTDRPSAVPNTYFPICVILVVVGRQLKTKVVYTRPTLSHHVGAS